MPAKFNQDSIGRRRRTRPLATGKRIAPQPRDLLWFAKLAEHGPLPTSFLVAFSEITHKSGKRARERLTDLFHEDNTPDSGAYLTRPVQQFRTIDARYNQLVYDLAPPATAALLRAGSAIRPTRSGPWVHSLMVSCITASFELACLRRSDLAYIPQSRILARAGVSLRWPAPIRDPNSGLAYTKDLLSDAVFGIEYRTSSGKRYRFFLLEADRATEPLRSPQIHRKSIVRHLLQYESYLECLGYRHHLKLTAPTMVLNVTTTTARLERMLELACQTYPSGNNYQLFRVWEDFSSCLRVPKPSKGLLGEPWVRAGASEICIG